MRLTIKGTIRCMVIITVKEILSITVKSIVRINGKCIVRCMVIITVKGTVTHSYLYPLCALVTLLRPTTNRLPTDAVSTRTCLDMSM